MPKMKTNKIAKKKFKVTGSGKLKHARAGTSHKTGKRSNKRNRHLKGTVMMDDTSRKNLQGLIPYR